MRLSRRAENLGESATLAVTRRARALQAEGKDVVNFGAGQPDFVTPRHIIEAAKTALDEGHTGYGVPASGLPIAKRAVCRKLHRDNGLEYAPEQVIITLGGKEALFLAFEALLDDGDEAVIPAPYWVSYPEQVKLAGGKPVVIQGAESRGFRITAEQLAQALTPRTRIVVLNYPSNPGGYSYSRAEMQQLAEALSGREIVVLADEMYDRLTYGEHKHFSWAALSQEAYDNSLTINAVSKSYAMTGWRLGYAAGPAPLINAMAKLQSQSTSGAANFNQHGLVAALEGDQQCVERMRVEYDRRRRLMYDSLRAMPGLRCVEPVGAFFCFPNISAGYERLGVQGSVAFARKLLDEALVAVVPGAAFGCDDHVRLSYALSEDRIREGLDRLQRFIGGC